MNADINRLLKNSAGRRCEQKRCRSASARNPTANTALGRVLRQQHSFS